MIIRVTNLSMQIKSLPLPGYRSIYIPSSENFILPSVSKDDHEFLMTNRILDVEIEKLSAIPNNSKVLDLSTMPVSYKLYNNTSEVNTNENDAPDEVEPSTLNNDVQPIVAGGTTDTRIDDTVTDESSIESKLDKLDLEQLRSLAKALKVITRSSNPSVVKNKILDSADDDSIANALEGTNQ